MYSRQIQSRRGGMLRGDRVGRKGAPRASPCSGFAVVTHRNRTSPHKNRGRSLMRISAVAAESKEAKAASALNEKLQIATETARELYKDMKLCREFEEMCAQMYYRGKMFGFVHLYSGQEACSTGVIKTLGPLDHVCSTYRDHAHAISKGVPSKYVLAELFGKKTGICRGQGGSMHMFSKEHRLLGGYAFIGEGIPIGVGAAFQAKYKHDVLGDKDSPMEVTASFFGDGTCNVGQFYECLNMASLYKLPHIFVVENNLWAIGMSHLRSTATEEQDNFPYIYKKGPAFGMPGVRVDGMDLLKVREVALTAVERARRGEGPTLIECETYRYRGHSLADPDELRDKKEKEAYAARDPIPRFRKHVVATGLLTEEQLSEIDAEVAEEVEAAVTFAEESPRPDKSQLLENVYADPRGFGVGPDGNYRYKSPGFTSGSVAVS